MPLLLFVAFVVVPVVEIYVLIQVGQAIGAGPTVALLLADAVLGTWLVRRQGRRAWNALREALEAGRVPGREVADGALVVLGGAFLLAPGFVTDLVGVLCLVPATRGLIRRLLTGAVTARVRGPAGPGGRDGRPEHPVIDGDVVDPERPGPA